MANRYLVLSLLALAVSCSVEETVSPDYFGEEISYDQEEFVEDNVITIKCSSDSNPETKTSFDADYNVLWDSGDKISLLYSGSAGDDQIVEDDADSDGISLTLLTITALDSMNSGDSKKVIVDCNMDLDQIVIEKGATQRGLMQR